ncbi:SH3-domain-containing protein [Pholiota conissans]|uniref:SH3-domain-containing protein n=1 Tax=Pholiota conissans TaxID=109636 RepID=A0A9P5Z3N7_9AGAR|nr:SH3-domain-containing protein [Pholiota conissans]
MVFANLQEHEKDAFFSLLDEYFSSRPDIFANHAAQSQGSQEAAVSAVGRAMAKNPEATASFMSAGLRHVANSRTGGSGANASGVSDNEVNSVAGRVAAASMAFSASARNSQPPPSRMSPPPVAEKPSAAPHLVQTKKFGNVDTSSTVGFLGSLRNKPAATSAPVAVPPAFAPKQNSYGPPPVRRAGSAAVSARSPTPEPAPPPAPPARHRPEPEPEEAAGEWAEALYDYQSDAAGDLELEEGQQVLVTERTSDDWWTGELNGKKGLFPASYVKLL